MRDETDQRFMALALDQARRAGELGEVPVGAVVVHDGRVIAAAHNRREIDRDPTAHAELTAIRQAAKALGAWRLLGCTLYVTLEPCLMCAGAMVLARIQRLVYGADDPKAGAAASLFRILEDKRLNHCVEVTAGVLGEPCAQVLSDFFRHKRAGALTDPKAGV